MSINVGIKAVISTAGIDRKIAALAAIPLIVEHFATLIHDETERLAPERTGADKASVKTELEAFAATISIGEGLDPTYGVYQELGFHAHGTGTFVQNPALIPAFLMYRDQFVEAIRAALSG